MMRYLKRSFALLLALILVGSVLPVQAFATETCAHDYESVVTDPTCTEKGYTTHTCTLCGDSYVDTYVNELRHNPEQEEGLKAGCLTDGFTSYSVCTRCGITLIEPEVLPAIGHNIEYVDAQAPTATKPGWEAYEKCTRCSYTTYVEIPALGAGTISDYYTFLMNLALLEELAYTYVAESAPDADPLALVIKYIRTGVDRYNSGSWGIMAGYEDASFREFVYMMEDMLNMDPDFVAGFGAPAQLSALKNIENMYLPNGDYVDLGHMFGTMDITYTNKNSQNHADVAGWAGDLVDLLSCADYHGLTGTLDELVKTISENYLCGNCDHADSFGATDMLGDMDGLYVMDHLLSTEYYSGAMMTLLMEYFTEELTMEDRAEYFLKNRLDGASTRNEVRNAVYNAYSYNKMISTLEDTREFNTQDMETLRKAVCYSFADYMCKLAGDYVEAGENPYYTVFQSESSVLAPGVTQEIKYAQSADGKQMVFFIATADITRDDVNLYANYHNNQPVIGAWKMARVLDQAQAAQNRWGDPESPDYIENYQVVVSTNAGGYDMSDGEPSGILIMRGVEYHPIDKNGFVGILDDGTAVIGTRDEWDTYKDRVQEAVAGFGTMLVKDGKVNITATSDYYKSRASRTSIGITKTGKIVMMVLDGRQEPYSCGGSMVEIAQIMMEAGCVTAVNLDGGGSSTFVARPEGETELKVINRPSDGDPRSVSTSLFVVSTAPSSTKFDHAVVDSEVAHLTVGSSVQMNAAGVSATGNAVELPEGTTWAVSDENVATITQDGILTALRNGAVEVQVYLDGGLVGSKTMNVVIPDRVYFTKTNMNAVYGQTVALPVRALYENKTVAINGGDVSFTLSDPTAAMVGEGFGFTGKVGSKIKQVEVTVSLTSNPASSSTMTVYLFNQGEATFDFNQATGGDRQLAWDRNVSNATTIDGVTYMIENADEKMVASYIFAIDMTQIPIPARLKDLTYMLPGSDLADASAWTFLLSLAQRISDLTTVRPTVKFSDNVDVDYSQIKVVNDYFTLESVEFDEQTNTLTANLRWKRQSQPINQANANPMCILSGVKVTPKEDAQWDSKDRLNVVLDGEVSYTIYMRASSLYSFSQKPENQETFGLTAYDNTANYPDDRGGKFSDTYKEFDDSFTLCREVKNGWNVEDGGFSYFVDGEKVTGPVLINDKYHLFDETGFTPTKEPYTGLFQMDGGTYYARLGELSKGWHQIGEQWYLFDWVTGEGINGAYESEFAGVTYEFDNGKLLHGVWVRTEQGLQYYYGPHYYKQGWKDIEGERYFFKEYYAMTGVSPVRPAHSVYDTWYEFDNDGKLIGEAKDGLYWYNGNLYYVVDTLSQHTGLYLIDGNYYYFLSNYTAVHSQSRWVSNTVVPNGTYRFDADGKMLMDTAIVEENGELYYYYQGRRVANAGLVQIDGDFYCIGEGAIAVRNQTLWVERSNGLKPKGVYTFGADGKLEVLNGIHDGIYYVDGAKTNAGVVLEDGNYYYAQWGGQIATNCSLWLSNTNGYFPVGTYRIDAEGKILLDTAIVEENGTLYYYENGCRVNFPGLVLLDGAYYYVQGAAVVTTDKTLWVEKNNGLKPKGTYTFGVDGKMVIYNGIVGDYYYENGTKVNAGLVEFEGNYYYTVSGGKLVKNTTYWVSVTHGKLPTGTYRFDAEGKMLLDTAIVNENGTLYYYENGRRVNFPGLVLLDGAYYYVESGAIVAADKTLWVEKNNNLKPKGTYTFGADGKMVIYNGIVGDYYYENGTKVNAGLVEFEGNYYYTVSGGKLVKDTTYWVSVTHGKLPTGTYRFDAEGKMLLDTAIVDENGTLYYYENGRRVNFPGLILLDGAYYYVESGAIVATNKTLWVEKNNDLKPKGTYTFGADGKMVIYNGIVGDYYYVNGDKVAAGLVEFEGNYYYTISGGKVIKDTPYWVSATGGYVPQGTYRFDAEGKMLLDTAIVDENGTLYYYENGRRINFPGLILLDGAYYYVESGAIVATNKTLWVEKNNDLKPKGTYTFGADGKMVQ
ncbi:MAG: phosphodiester glycosidase family protein [Oscillospiraceae bacterium]|nr:phosphodiester glycosidase family protein [Oscillospiraceae bacterium]